MTVYILISHDRLLLTSLRPTCSPPITTHREEKMSLQVLPPELLSRIIYFTQPTGFENFALSNRSIYACAEPHIAAHNRRKVQWRRVCIGEAQQSASFQYRHRGEVQGRDWLALDYLYAVAVVDPRIPAYVEELDFADQGDMRWQQQGLRESGEEKAEEWWKDVDGALRWMKDLVTSSPYLRDAGVDVGDWVAKMFDADMAVDGGRPTYRYQAHMLFFILTLVGNISLLKMDTWSWGTRLRLLDSGAVEEGNEEEKYPELGRVLDFLIRNANEKYKSGGGGGGSSSGDTVALGKLRTLSQCDEQALCDDPTVPLRCHARLLALQSLEEFSAAYSTAYGPYSISTPPSPPSPSPSLLPPVLSNATSNLRRLSLTFSDITPASLTNFLTSLSLPRLESFTYSHETVWHLNQEPYWDVGALVAGLGRCSGASLKHLALYIETNGRPGMFDRGLKPVTGESLRGFERLRALELDCFVFLASGVAGAGREGADAELERATQHLEAVPALREILPPSVKDLYLGTARYSRLELRVGLGLLRALLKGFEREEMGLERFRVQCQRPLNDGGRNELILQRELVEGAGGEYRNVI